MTLPNELRDVMALAIYHSICGLTGYDDENDQAICGSAADAALAALTEAGYAVVKRPTEPGDCQCVCADGEPPRLEPTFDVEDLEP